MSTDADISMTESKSTAIIGHGHGYDYDHNTKTLVLKFNGGRMYRYADVPQDIYDGLKAADSKGRFYGSRIAGQFKTI